MQDFPTTIVFTMLALAIVIALAWLILKFLSSISKGGRSNQHLRVVSNFPLNSRSRVMVLNYRGHDYLLGVSPEHISLIDKHEESASTNSSSEQSLPAQ